jgi:hypothetical protein
MDFMFLANINKPAITVHVPCCPDIGIDDETKTVVMFSGGRDTLHGAAGALSLLCCHHDCTLHWGPCAAKSRCLHLIVWKSDSTVSFFVRSESERSDPLSESVTRHMCEVQPLSHVDLSAEPSPDAVIIDTCRNNTKAM